MLEDREDSARPRHAQQFPHPMRMLIVWNVMENTSRESHIERAFLMRNLASREYCVLLRSWETPAAHSDAACGRVRAGQSRVGEILSEERYRVADARAKIQNSRAFDVQFAGKTSQLSDFVACEIFGALAGDSDIGPMEGFICFSELIKFSTIHISLPSPKRSNVLHSRPMKSMTASSLGKELHARTDCDRRRNRYRGHVSENWRQRNKVFWPALCCAAVSRSRNMSERIRRKQN